MIHTESATISMKIRRTAALLLAPALLLLSACTREEVLDSSIWKDRSDRISFGISRQGEEGLTKGGSGHLVMRSAGSDDTLCVRVSVTDGIGGGSFGGGEALTRAEQVSSIEDYGGFHVQARSYTGNAPDGEFYMDDDVTEQSGDIWSTGQVYYWPGSGRTLDFYAWAPADAHTTPGLGVPSSPSDGTTLSYTVPSDVSEQIDISVAAAAGIPGNLYQAVSLEFNHIFTAVRFVVGEQMQPGTIKSVALKGVYGSGTYDMESQTGEGTGTWSLDENSTVDFSQSLEVATGGEEGPGSAITAPEGTFMMLPQTLPMGAAIEVVFRDEATGTDRTLTASIAGTQWPIGKTVTYRLSITPEYDFYFEGYQDQAPLLDAHYEIFLATLVADVPEGTQWTITAPTIDGKDVTIQNQAGMNSWAQQGYWTDRNMEAVREKQMEDRGSARGENSYYGSGSGEFSVAVFVPENIGDATRTIELEVKVGDQAVQTIAIEQYAPSWYDNNSNGHQLGCERLEGKEEPWGPSWDEDYKLVYNLENCSDSDREAVSFYVRWTKLLSTVDWVLGGLLSQWIGEIPDLGFVDMETSGGILGMGSKADVITINLGELVGETSSLAVDEDNGQQNTRDIYNFEGIQFVNDIINSIQNMEGYRLTTSGKGVFPTDNASIACMKLNSWNIVTAEVASIGESEIITLTNSDDPEWYLPSRNEVLKMADDEFPLQGYYWTSTSYGANDNTRAYKYVSASGTTEPEAREAVLHVRAVRQKP